jgi:predicted transcriptional regulator
MEEIMTDNFIVRPKNADKKEDKSVVMTLRLDRDLQKEFDQLSAKSERSRNELMCMALRYALNHLEFIPDSNEEL